MDFYNWKGLHSPIPGLFIRTEVKGKQVNVGVLQKQPEMRYGPVSGAALLSGLGSCPGVPTEAGSGTGHPEGPDFLGMRSLRRVIAAQGRLEWTGAGKGMPTWLTELLICSSSMALGSSRGCCGAGALWKLSLGGQNQGWPQGHVTWAVARGPVLVVQHSAITFLKVLPFCNEGPCVFTLLSLHSCGLCCWSHLKLVALWDSKKRRQLSHAR